MYSSSLKYKVVKIVLYDLNEAFDTITTIEAAYRKTGIACETELKLTERAFELYFKLWALPESN